jgi:hypothetical protein
VKLCNGPERLSGIIGLASVRLLDGTATNTVRRTRVGPAEGPSRPSRWCGHPPERDDHAADEDDVGRHRDDDPARRRDAPRAPVLRTDRRDVGASFHPRSATVSRRTRTSRHRHRAARPTDESRHIPPQHPTDSPGAPPIAPVTRVGRPGRERASRTPSPPIRVPGRAAKRRAPPAGRRLPAICPRAPTSDRTPHRPPLSRTGVHSFLTPPRRIERRFADSTPRATTAHEPPPPTDRRPSDGGTRLLFNLVNCPDTVSDGDVGRAGRGTRCERVCRPSLISSHDRSDCPVSRPFPPSTPGLGSETPNPLADGRTSLLGRRAGGDDSLSVARRR